MPERTCNVDGCVSRHQAKGLCSTHYNQQHQPNRHAKAEVTCGHCGQPCMKAPSSKYAERFCSLICRDLWRAETRGSRHDYLPVAVIGIRGSCDLPPSHSAFHDTRGTLRWTSAYCRICHEPFVDPNGTVTCSDACRLELRRQRRRIRRAYEKTLTRGGQGAFTLSEWGARLRQYSRRCAYCQDPDQFVEIEHVIPLCRGGANRITNVVPSCRACNIEKHTLTAAEWLLSGRPRVATGVAGPHQTPSWPAGHME